MSDKSSDKTALKIDDEVLGKAYDPRIAQRLLSYLDPYRGRFGLALALMISGSAAALAGPYLIKIALDNGVGRNDVRTLALAVAGFVIASVINYLATYRRIVLLAVTGQDIIFDLRSQLFHHLSELSMSFYTRVAVGRLISRVVGDVSVLREMITWAVIAVANDILTLIGIVVVMLTLNLKLSLLTFLVVPVMVAATVVYRRHIRDSFRNVRRAISRVTGYVAENIAGVRVVQAFSREERNLAAFRDEINKNNLNANLRATLLASVFFPTVDFIGSLTVGLIVWVGATQVMGQEITAGVLVAFVLYIDQFFNPIRDLSQRYSTFQATMAAGERIFEVLDTQPDVIDRPHAVEMPPIRGEVRFENVEFAYDDGVPVLCNVNLQVQPGQIVALVGETGAGKSSLVKLLARFYDVTHGRILVDDMDVRAVKQTSLRGQMAYVLQDTFLFSGSVADNIRYGKPGATDAEVIAAAKAVGADEFIRRMKNGYDTNVEEGGVVLSTGQRQLTSFARALLANPRILILDEATSSVDTQTEKRIQAAMSVLLQGRTAFVIAHRLSTITQANQIVVVEGGEIVESGTHHVLLSRRGRYYDLYTMAFMEPEAVESAAQSHE